MTATVWSRVDLALNGSLSDAAHLPRPITHEGIDLLLDALQPVSDRLEKELLAGIIGTSPSTGLLAVDNDKQQADNRTSFFGDAY